MNKKIISVGVASLILAAAATTAFAYQGDATKRGPNYTPEREAAMTAAMTSGNYEAWKKLAIPGTRVSSVVKETNFPKFVQIWKLEKEGKSSEARVLRSELGLGVGARQDNASYSRTGRGMGRGAHRNF